MSYQRRLAWILLWATGLAPGQALCTTPNPPTTSKATSLLQLAHEAIAQHQFDTAWQTLTQLLTQDPTHLDALLSLAALAQHRGDARLAAQYYRSAYAAHPLNSRAQAGFFNPGLAAAAGQSAGNHGEAAASQLRQWLDVQPQAAALHFALGNLRAAQGRWEEAQAAYFEACRLETSHPDYRYNLAVSLDQLHQPRAATQHYRAALAAAAQRPPAFDPGKVQARLQQLENTPQPTRPATASQWSPQP